jgi:geranylgeranyl diphosphate synthase type II
VDVGAYMTERIPLIDAGIEARFQAGTGFPAALQGAMRHLLFPGGKRLRPIFALAAAEAVGGSAEAALPIAVAVELVHTYSLIHDDLPCMDDDATRRGRPTVHVAYDEATAVLAGDALLTEAFAVLAESGPHSRDAETALRTVHCLAMAAGAAGLVGGQADDLLFSSRTEAGQQGAAARSGSGAPVEGTDYGRLAFIHARKTAALFQAAIVGGATLASATEVEREQLDVFGKDIGIAFQIVDDLLDADREEAVSILRIQGLDDAKQGAEGLLEHALLGIESMCERAEPLRELARFAVRRKR